MSTGNPSESRSTSQNTTETIDTTTANSGAGVAIGAGASYIQEFPTAVADAFNKIIDFASGALTNAAAIVTGTLQNNQAVVTQANQTAANAVSNSQLGQDSILAKIAPIAVIGGLIVAGLWAFRKG
jgi:hypothetical protein